MTNVTVLRNPMTISAKVAEILSTLPKGHSRYDAYKKINEEKIKDSAGKLIVPSVWYHNLALKQSASTGKTYMQEMYPDFVPTGSSYSRTKVNETVEDSVEIDRNTLNRIAANLAAVSKELESFTGKSKASNSFHATIHSNDTTGMVNEPKMRRARGN